MILIVDDHLDTCEALISVLRLERIHAECVNDPKKVIAAIRLFNPTLLVLDQMMPGMLGTDLLKEIRAIPEFASLPAIFYSASDSGHIEATRLRIIDWIVKGRADWAELRVRIADAYHRYAPAR